MTAWIANACGFWGDRIDAASTLLTKEPNIQYLTLDYLSELSMSIMAVQQERDPASGYAKDFVDVVDTLVDFWNQGRSFKIVTNAGGLNPRACALALKKLLDNSLNRPLKIAIVSGDNVLTHFNDVWTANAYLGASSLVEAFANGADIVVAGRIADPSLTVACAAYHLGWPLHDYNLIAQATVAGHLIECGCQVTGGLMDNWLEQPYLSEMGYPFVIMQKDGSFFLKKPEKTGGQITVQGVKEQLIYEIMDPGCYLSPDATVNFQDLKLQETGQDTILIQGAKGSPPPSTYKVSTTVRRGWQAGGEIGLVGNDLQAKGEKICDIILKRLSRKGHEFDAVNVSLIGAHGLCPYLHNEAEAKEALLRINVRGEDKKSVELFTKELAPFITCGPKGVCAYTASRSSVRPFFEFIPGIIDRNKVKPTIEYLEAGCG